MFSVVISAVKGIICFVIVVVLSGCTSTNIHKLSEMQSMALQKHKDQDVFVHQTLKEISRKAAKSVDRMMKADLERAFSETLANLYDEVDRISSNVIETGLAEIQSLMQSVIDEAKQELQKKEREVGLASSDKKAEAERDFMHAKALVADYHAIMLDAQLTFVNSIHDLERDRLASGKKSLQDEYRKGVEISESFSTQLEAELFAGLDAEIQALDNIINAQNALNKYLNRPNAMALILAGGFSEAGIDIGVDRLDAFFKNSENKLRTAAYRYIGGEEERNSKVFKKAFQDIGSELKESFEDDVKEFGKKKLKELGEEFKGRISI